MEIQGGLNAVQQNIGKGRGVQLLLDSNRGLGPKLVKKEKGKISNRMTSSKRVGTLLRGDDKG